MLCCVILCCVILYCIVLCFVVLCYVMLHCIRVESTGETEERTPHTELVQKNYWTGAQKLSHFALLTKKEIVLQS